MMTAEERDAFLDRKDGPIGYYDRLGVRISLREWAVLMDDLAYKRIAGTDVGRWWISTVWLGMDHGLGGILGEPPLIFETMVFDRDGAPGDDWEMRRYSTEEQARQGHEEMVQLVETLEGVSRKEVESD